MEQKLVEMIENAKIPDKEKIEMICVAYGLIPIGEAKDEFEIKKILDPAGLQYKEYNGFLLFSAYRERIDKLKEASKIRNDYVLGLMWGYPLCCVEYFSKEAGGEEAFSAYLKEIRKRINDREHIEYYFRDYVPCPVCVKNKNSPSGRLEEKIEGLLSKASPKLHESFYRIKNNKSGDINGEWTILQFEDSQGNLQRVNYDV